MTRLELTQTITVPPPHVFVFFVPQRMPYWYGAEMRSCFEVQDGAPDFRVGLKVRISGQVGRKNVSHTAVVTAFEYARVFEWRFHDTYGVRGRERWELEPGAAGAPQTNLRFIDEYEIPGRLGQITDWLITRHALARRNRNYLDRLARLAERRA